MEIFFGIIERVLAKYRVRRWLRKSVAMTLPSGETLSGKKLIELADLAEKQALLRQIYGLASSGGSCQVTFTSTGEVIVTPLKKEEKNA